VGVVVAAVARRSLDFPARLLSSCHE
jgi:hypothetical protein